MASSKKPAKTSKTAHVLNVITGGQESGEPLGAEESPQPAPSPRSTLSPRPAVQPAPPPLLEVTQDNDDGLSQQILGALAEEMGIELPSLEPTTRLPDPVQPVQPQPAPLPTAQPARPVGGVESDYVNVVQALVEEKAPKYLEMLGVCRCSRCVADVKALALSNLPPKYIVVPKSQRVPMLTVYEGHYNAAITAQLIAACRTVVDHPRHEVKKI